MKKLHLAILAGSSALALAGCGADDVVAPNGNIIVNPTPGPSPSPSPTPSGSVTAAAACTAGTSDGGTIVLKNSKGTIRNCVLPATIAGTLNLTGRRADGIMYSLAGRTNVGTDPDVPGGGTTATLNVLPGVTVFGQVKESNLVVNRGSKLNADGTQAQPIIFTSRTNLDSALAEEATNQWGGIILNGRAPVADCDVAVSPAGTQGGTANCWRQSEGVVPRPIYGGATANDNSGTLRYVQINFTGVPVGANDEIQGLTLNGVGSGTTLEFIQVHNSSDDGIEAFGGTANMKRIVLTGNADDSLDVDNGYRGAVQYALGVRWGASGYDGDTGARAETLLEVDSSVAATNDSNPRTFLKLANFTFIQQKSGETSLRIRGGADIALLNGIVVARPNGAQGCFDVNDAATVQTTAGTAFAAGDVAGAEAGKPIIRSTVFDCEVVSDTDGDTFEADTLTNTPNPLTNAVNTAFTNALAFLTGSSAGAKIANGSTESAVAGTTALATDPVYGSSFFQQVAYIGAFSGASDLWTQGWTCNSTLVDLRGGNSCTDVRID